MERIIAHSEIRNPSQTCLLVVDYQQQYATAGHGYFDFVAKTATDEELLQYQRAIKNISLMIELARDAQIPIVFLQFDQQDSAARPQYLIGRDLRLGIRGGESQPNSNDLVISPKDHEIVVKKTGFDGFENTDLHVRLQELGVVNLIVVGLTTELCVYNTLVSAVTKFGYRCIAVQDAMAARLKSLHDAFLFVFSRNFGELYTTAELVDVLQK